jgi:O-antigen/teichoic acid export membrane protein
LSNNGQKTESLRSSSAWLLAAKLIAFACSFALPLVIVRILTQDQAGEYRLAFQVVTNAVVILPLGFSMSAFYFLARTPERRPSAIFNILLFNFIVGALAALAMWLEPGLIGNLFKSETLTKLGPAIGLVIWISIFGSFLETVALANSESKVATGFIVFSALSKTLLMGSAVVIFGSVPAIVYAAMVQAAIQTLILLWYLHSRFQGWWRSFDGAFFAEHTKYAIPFGLTGVLWIAQTEIHTYFVGYQFSHADVAIYTYGCFQLPLIAMLSESVSSVLIPRMNALQQAGDVDEMVRLSAKAMEKLALVYFPVYAFFLVTAGTFITTLFTQEYARSVPVFMVNLTLILLGVVITDPIVRSFKELGRLLLLTRVCVLAGLIGVLYYGIGRMSLVGYIATAVGAIVLEKAIGETMVVRKLGLGLRHLPLLKNVAKTAVASAAAGLATFVAYASLHVEVADSAARIADEILPTLNANIRSSIGGAVVLAASALVFAPVYLAAANLFGLIEEGEKELVLGRLRRLAGRGPAVAETKI